MRSETWFYRRVMKKKADGTRRNIDQKTRVNIYDDGIKLPSLTQISDICTIRRVRRQSAAGRMSKRHLALNLKHVSEMVRAHLSVTSRGRLSMLMQFCCWLFQYFQFSVISSAKMDETPEKSSTTMATFKSLVKVAFVKFGFRIYLIKWLPWVLVAVLSPTGHTRVIQGRSSLFVGNPDE